VLGEDRPYVLLAAGIFVAVVQIPLMTKALKDYTQNQVFIVTIFSGTHFSTACISGQVVLREMADVGWYRYLGYWTSILVIIAGLFTIQRTFQDTIVPSTKAGPKNKDAVESMRSTSLVHPITRIPSIIEGFGDENDGPL